MLMEGIRKDINNSLKEIQENTSKHREALKELKENMTKQVKELNKIMQDLKNGGRNHKKHHKGKKY